MQEKEGNYFFIKPSARHTHRRKKKKKIRRARHYRVSHVSYDYFLIDIGEFS